jgi:RNA polymerase sigma-32 factor
MQDAVLSSRAKTRYLEEIRHFPILKAEEEYALAARWRGRADESAAHQLLTSHLRLVVKIAMGYRRYGLPVSDLISEGNIGLMRAVRRFDPDKGARFSTYALWWIKAAIQDYIVRSWSLVKMGTTLDQRKLFFNLGKAKHRLSALGEGDLRPDQVALVAGGLGVSEKEVVEMNRRLSGDISLNAPLNEDGDSGEWQERLVDEASDQESRVAESDESEIRREALRVALRVLDDRERQIFEGRRLFDPPRTLEELATRFGISRERIRQIEDRAFRKVQRAVHGAMSRTRHSSTRRPNDVCGSIGAIPTLCARQGCDVPADGVRAVIVTNHLGYG